MKKVLIIAALACGLSACGPDNQGACEEAQASLQTVYDDCGVDTAVPDLSCEIYADITTDCTAVFEWYDGYTCEEMAITPPEDTVPTCS